MLKALLHARRNARDLAELRDKARTLLVHASGGNAADITRPIKDLCGDIYRHHNNIHAAAKALGAASVTPDPLAGYSDAERRVLDELHEDRGVRLTTVSIYTRLPRGDVATIVRMFALRNLVRLVPLFDEERGTLGGRGYCLTGEGEQLQLRNRRAIRMAAAAAVESCGGEGEAFTGFVGRTIAAAEMSA